MNASKESAQCAMRNLETIDGAVRQHIDTLPNKTILLAMMDEIRIFILKAESKLPSEAAYEREKQRRASKPKLKSSNVPGMG